MLDSNPAARRLSISLIGACAIAAAAPAAAQLTVRMKVPPSTAGAPIYIAGSFNKWEPAEPANRLTRVGDDEYAITLPASVRGRVEFKLTLGSWETVETTSTGTEWAINRQAYVPDTGRVTYTGEVGGWRDGAPRPRPASTATASVSLMDSAFAIPQFERTRRVRIYLPPGYASSRESYPVLYMHDGQNMFDLATAYGREWRVDESLDSLRARGDRGVIVVAVDNGGKEMVNEYSPWVNLAYGPGDGEKYAEFLVSTLKPYVDRHYRTRPDRLDTGVAGGGLGGLLTLYAALEHPEVFGRAAVFSPSLWYAGDSVYAWARGTAAPHPGTRLYLAIGSSEGEREEDSRRYRGDFQRMVDTLAAVGFRPGADLSASVRESAEHGEPMWGREFPAAYLWLFREAERP